MSAEAARQGRGREPGGGRGELARVAVLGAGVAGLAAAYELSKRARHSRRPFEVVLLEASSRAGGKVLTDRVEGLTIEGGADSFITVRPHALELARELGLESELAGCDEARAAISIYAGGRLRRFPAGMSLVVPGRLWPFLSSDLLTWGGKLRAMLEPFVPAPAGAEDESLGAFFRRRMGPEFLERVAGPLLAGIYAADPEQMSLESTFPQLRAMESEGGLYRALRRRKKASAPALPMFMTFQGGLSRLPEALAARLPPRALRLGFPVERLERRGSAWTARGPQGALECQAVVSALPAPALSEALADEDLELAGVLREIPFASTATVTLAYAEAELPRPLSGFGFLVCRGQGKLMSAATFSSVKFPGRAPKGQALVRVFFGGAGREEALSRDDAGLAALAVSELSEILALGPARPWLTRVHRWPRANPQYSVGHALRIKRIESCLKAHAGLFLAGASYYGVGVPDCVASGRKAAAKAAEFIESRRRS